MMKCELARYTELPAVGIAAHENCEQKATHHVQRKDKAGTVGTWDGYMCEAHAQEAKDGKHIFEFQKREYNVVVNPLNPAPEDVAAAVPVVSTGDVPAADTGDVTAGVPPDVLP